VITPLLTRALGRSEDEFFQILRRATEAVLICIVPITMMIGLGAPFWMRISVGKDFLAGAGALAQLAPSFVFTYVAVLFATALIILKRSWSVTVISLTRLALQPLLMWIVIPLTQAKLQTDGAAGVGDAFVFSLLEFFVACAFMVTLGRRALDKRMVFAAGKAALAFVAAGLTHRALEPYGPWRLIADACVYAGVFLGLGGLRPSEVKWVINMVRSRRRGA
jgi:O-antigen/teichoic acid export membrane protein